MTYRLGVLVSHPIQYLSPWFRHLANKLDLEVFYAHRQSARGQAEAGFGVEFDWDVPLLEGYSYRWLTNVARQHGLRSFGGCDTPEIYDIIQHGRFDAFLVFGWNRKSSIQAILACKRTGTPVLMRGDSQLNSTRSPLKSAAKFIPYRLLLPRLDGHLYVGKRNKEYLQHYGVREDRLFFVPHFVDNDYFARSAKRSEVSSDSLRIRDELGIPRDAFVFIYAGKMIPEKRPQDFIQALSKILYTQTSPNIHALLIGDGPMRSFLEKLAKPHSDRIHFVGFQNQTRLPLFYQASDALILPGQETWGLVVNEAAACGIPSVVSDAAGCATDLIEEGVTGYTFPMGDVNALAGSLSVLMQALASDRSALYGGLKRVVSLYSIEKATKGLAQALQGVTEGRAGTLLKAAR